jgi:phosphatidylserine/phosphatidylglycerophosphate/cardiolipin synthase-like enzyme
LRAGIVFIVLAASLFAVAQGATAATGASRLSLITEPNAGMGPIFSLLASAQHSVDVVMYELVDPRAEAILTSDAARGVRVRVLLDKQYEASANAAAFSYLSNHGVEVHWASSRFSLTHEKAAVIDDRTALVMTLNLVARDYASTRDFAVVDSQPLDVAAIESVFSEDWTNTSGSAPTGEDLVWSPGAETALVKLIGSATRSLLVENEEMSDPYITAPLEAAARRGIVVDVVMTRSSSWSSAFDALTRAGVHVRTYSPSASLYIHAKVIVADAADSHGTAFVGSQNFSIESLIYNRELGLITANAVIVHGLAGTVASDFASATPWSA